MTDAVSIAALLTTMSNERFHCWLGTGSLVSAVLKPVV